MFGYRKKNIDGVVTIEIPQLKEHIDKFITESEVLQKDKKLFSDMYYKLFNEMYDLKQNLNFVECEKCGCLLNKKTAYRGEPIKVIKPTNPMADLGDAISNLINASKGIDTGDKNEYELKEVYYCKIHKPKPTPDASK